MAIQKRLHKLCSLKVALFHKAPAQRMEAVALALFCSDLVCVVTAGREEGYGGREAASG